MSFSGLHWLHLACTLEISRQTTTWQGKIYNQYNPLTNPKWFLINFPGTIGAPWSPFATRHWRWGPTSGLQGHSHFRVNEYIPYNHIYTQFRLIYKYEQMNHSTTLPSLWMISEISGFGQTACQNPQVTPNHTYLPCSLFLRGCLEGTTPLTPAVLHASIT